MKLHEKRYTATKVLYTDHGDERNLWFELEIKAHEGRIYFKPLKSWRSKEETIEYLEWCIEQIKTIPEF